jgi:UDP:flavonoid glycosyltransferase YjiC (YdhE family)
MDEQLFWGCQLQALGLAFAPLSARKVNAQSLAKTMQKVLGSEILRNNATSYSRQMQKRNGVAAAVNLIETQLSRLSAL